MREQCVPGAPSGNEAMRTHAVKCYEGAISELSLAIRWQESLTKV